MRKHFWWIGLLLLMVGIVFIPFFGAEVYFHQDMYTGKEAFWTTEEYTAFKEFLAEDSVKDFKITILQSEIPIIAKLNSLIVEKDSYCPYGELSGWRDLIGAPWMLYTGIPMVVVGAILIRKDKEEKK